MLHFRPPLPLLVIHRQRHVAVLPVQQVGCSTTKAPACPVAFCPSSNRQKVSILLNILSSHMLTSLLRARIGNWPSFNSKKRFRPFLAPIPPILILNFNNIGSLNL